MYVVLEAAVLCVVQLPNQSAACRSPTAMATTLVSPRTADLTTCASTDALDAVCSGNLDVLLQQASFTMGKKAAARQAAASAEVEVSSFLHASSISSSSGTHAAARAHHFLCMVDLPAHVV